MDRVWSAPWDGRDGDRDEREGVALPSRRAAIEALLPGLNAQAGPLLITGDAGVGKTWLLRQLEDLAPADWGWLRVDLSPAVTVADLYNLIGHELGLGAAPGPGSSRVEIAGRLREQAVDGSPWVLAVDEAHGASDDVLEEVRVLSNQVGRPGGFAAIVLVGQTALALRLGTRALRPLASRIAAQVHLRPLDIEEARSLVEALVPGAARDRERFEVRHRDTAGNPKRLLQVSRLAAPRVAREVRVSPQLARVPAPVPIPFAAPEPEPMTEAPAARRWEAPVLGEAKPPIREEEGLIEVGWSPEVPANADEEPLPTESTPAEAYPPETEETISDHYAALQAWNEWANNQGRVAGVARADAAGSRTEPAHGESEADVDADLDLDETGAGGLPGASPDVWAEGQQEFAPYSQLFSRMRQRRDSN